MNVLVTGGAGYIGSHACVELLNSGHEIIVLDNFVNSKPKALKGVESIAGKTLELVEGDVRDQNLLERLFKKAGIHAVMHFAGLKAVGESVENPLEYYDNNVFGTIVLLKAMRKFGVKKFVFSSSATVYGEPKFLPITEDHPLTPINPYGWSKLICEQLIRDLGQAWPEFSYAILRYFNPAGAHPSGKIGEDPNGEPNNLVPYIAQVAQGLRPKLRIWGDDYPTKDGTGVRDYIHVLDLVEGHLRALEKLEDGFRLTVNLGTGRGYSVKEVLDEFRRVLGRDIPFEICARRPGDVAECYADPGLSKRTIDWLARRRIREMCENHWNWQRGNAFQAD